MNRRTVLKSLAATGAGTLISGSSPVRAMTHALPSGIQATLTAGEHIETSIPVDYMGLSYETSQLAHPAFFSANTQALVRSFRLLGHDGVLRIGGNMSEFSFWSPNAPSEESPDGVEGSDPGHGSDRTYRITPAAIDRLVTFLDATGWKLIYGLNLAASDPATAADEAAYVAGAVGDRLIALQFGNEPDLFKHNKNPKDHWTYTEFIEHWQRFYDAVHKRVPHVPIAGPDTSYQPQWMERFASEERARIALLTGHYYAGGPPTDPKMTTGFLLEPNSRLKDHVLKAIEIARAHGLPYRMSEGNTCYGAGKKGVSDTFASALWAVDFCLELAREGSIGVNLHGGGNGFYTPISGSPSTGFTMRPIFYGLLLAGQLSGSQLLSSTLSAEGRNLAGYVARKGSSTSFVIINREPQRVGLTLKLASSTPGDKQAASIWRLTAPALESTTGVTLAGAAVDGNGNWQPSNAESINFHDGVAQLELPPYSAALVRTVRG